MKNGRVTGACEVTWEHLKSLFLSPSFTFPLHLPSHVPFASFLITRHSLSLSSHLSLFPHFSLTCSLSPPIFLSFLIHLSPALSFSYNHRIFPHQKTRLLSLTPHLCYPSLTCPLSLPITWVTLHSLLARHLSYLHLSLLFPSLVPFASFPIRRDAHSHFPLTCVTYPSPLSLPITRVTSHSHLFCASLFSCTLLSFTSFLFRRHSLTHSHSPFTFLFYISTAVSFFPRFFLHTFLSHPLSLLLYPPHLSSHSLTHTLFTPLYYPLPALSSISFSHILFLVLYFNFLASLLVIKHPHSLTLSGFSSLFSLPSSTFAFSHFLS